MNILHQSKELISLSGGVKALQNGFRSALLVAPVALYFFLTLINAINLYS